MKPPILPFPSSRAAALLVGLALAASAGCSNSSLGAHNKKEDVEVVDGGTEPQPIEDCPQLCADAFDTYAALGCDVTCDIDLGTTVQGGLDILVVTLAVTSWFDVDLGVETGQTCDMVIDCPEITDCLTLSLLCLDDSDNDADYCISEYLDCTQETMCNDERSDCYDNAWDAYSSCNGTYAECGKLYDRLSMACEIQNESCLGAGDEPAPPPPLPTMTAAGRFDVPMGFVQHHLQRLATLEMETFTMRMPATDTSPAGLALHSIQAGDTLDQLGLIEGDLVVRVNDTSVLAVSENPAVLLNALDDGGVKVTIRRNGIKRDLRYRFVD